MNKCLNLTHFFCEPCEVALLQKFSVVFHTKLKQTKPKFMCFCIYYPKSSEVIIVHAAMALIELLLSLTAAIA